MTTGEAEDELLGIPELGVAAHTIPVFCGKFTATGLLFALKTGNTIYCPL